MRRSNKRAREAKDIDGAAAMNTEEGRAAVQDLDALEAQLEARRQAISRELGDIPLPAPACDVHFNRLLEERGLVVDTLQALRKLRRESASPARVTAFLAAARKNGIPEIRAHAL